MPKQNDPIIISLSDLIKHHGCEADQWESTIASCDYDVQKTIIRQRVEYHRAAVELLTKSKEELERYDANTQNRPRIADQVQHRRSS